MSIDTKHDDLQSLRIDRSHRSGSEGEPPKWAKRYILGGIAVVVLLSLIALVYRVVSPSAAEVEVVRAATEGGGDAGGVVLSAGGYIVAHHKINVNSKVTGRVKWIGAGVARGTTEYPNRLTRIKREPRGRLAVAND